MWSSLKNYSDAALLFVRGALGLLFLTLHAWPKLVSAVDVWGHHSGHRSFWASLWFTIFAFAETLASLLLIFGKWARCASLFWAIVVALYATNGLHSLNFTVHERDIELVLLLVVLFFVGPGKFSFDKS